MAIGPTTPAYTLADTALVPRACTRWRANQSAFSPLSLGHRTTVICGDVGDRPGDTARAGVTWGRGPPVKIRPTSVQGLLRTGAEDGERRRRPDGRGPRRDHAADRPAATWLANGKRFIVNSDRQLRQHRT